MRQAEELHFTVLVPFDPRESMTLAQAAKRSAKSESTVRGWCINRGIGRRVAGGVWHVSKPALEMLLDGDAAALAAYHSGDRSAEVVRQYFERTGVPCSKTTTRDVSKTA
jgi:hypothetical protein